MPSCSVPHSVRGWSQERLCRDSLIDPVQIVVGDLGEANTDITQVCGVGGNVWRFGEKLTLSEEG